MIPTVELKLCEYNPKFHKLTLPSEYFGMPKEFYVHSHHTGRTILFRTIGENHPMFDQDQWDGEQMIYEPVDVVKNVKILVIYHQY
jgi:hypothetical protein